MRADAYSARSGNPGGRGVIVWWTPDCGYLHVETDPLAIALVCPDGVRPPRRRRRSISGRKP